MQVGTVVAVALAMVGVPASSSARPVTGAPDCSIFPADNPWNQRVDSLPVAAGSSRMVRAMGLTRLHADFSDSDGEGYGIPHTVVDSSAPRRTVTFEYADESDLGPYPLPNNAQIEGGSDRHVLLLEREQCRLYELFGAERQGNEWTAGSGASWDLHSNVLRPAGWTSADGAGLPILPGLARHEELAGGGIDHALRFTLPTTQRAFLWPARHYASSNTEPWHAPMGLRVRVKAGFRTSGYPTQARAVLEALKRYGMIVADNGSAGFISGAPGPGWDDDDLHTLHRVPAGAFEVVDVSAVVGTPTKRRIWNLRFSSSSTHRIAHLFHTRRGKLLLQAVRGGRVVRSVTVTARQGYVRLQGRKVRGATWRVRVVR